MRQVAHDQPQIHLEKEIQCLNSFDTWNGMCSQVYFSMNVAGLVPRL